MTIRLPEDLERYVRDEVKAGRFRGEDEVIADAFDRHRQAEARPAAPAPTGGNRDVAPPMPIWEMVDELHESVPPARP